jgi:hypothetical protein
MKKLSEQQIIDQRGVHLLAGRLLSVGLSFQPDGPPDCESTYNLDPMDMKSIKRIECRSAPGPHAETHSRDDSSVAPRTHSQF